MNKSITLLSFCILLCIGRTAAQSFSPISLTGYNFDAVAEATTAAANTTGPIDGSNYVMYSVSYGTVYNVTTGLPNSGVIASGTSTYQLGTYSLNNVCLITSTLTTDSLVFASPAAYSGISILCFSTEGSGSMSVTVRFTDNTTQTYGNQTLSDWFLSSGAVYSGFDRVNRTGTTPANALPNPNMFAINLPISCANRSKSIKNVKFQHPGTNPRNVIMAISGAAMPTFSATSSPVTCLGGINGSATVTASGGIAPYSYTWSTTPAQNGASVSSLGVGLYTVTAQDAGLCPVTTTVAVSQSLVAQPPLAITASVYTICAGAPVTMTTSGVTTYTWNTAANTYSILVNPSTSTTYTVGGYTSFNCYRTGSVAITVNPLPVINFTTPASVCLNTPQFSLTATPVNGVYTGTGVNASNMYVPATAGVGTKTLSYTSTDIYGCVSTQINTIVVNALPVVTFTLSQNSLCTNSTTLTLTAAPVNGTFTGAGVNGLVYSPSVAGVGTQTVSYTYTDANNCTVVKTSSVIINSVTTPTFTTTKKVFCVFNPTLYLNAQPSGGVFTGAGTSTVGIFSPTLAGVGTHTLTYTYTDANGCVGKALFGTTVSACSSILENNGDAHPVTIYPNPSNGTFTIKATSAMNLVLTNDLGQWIATLKLDESTRFEISVADLPTGIYFIRGENDLQMIREKLVITR